MKKILLILMPITIVLSIFAVILNKKDISYLQFLDGLSELEFEKFPMQTLIDAYSKLDLTDIWTGIWDNIQNAVDWFGAVGNSIKAVGESIVRIGQMLWGTINFGFQTIGWFFNNLIIIIRFIGYYIGVLVE